MSDTVVFLSLIMWLFSLSLTAGLIIALFINAAAVPLVYIALPIILFCGAASGKYLAT